MLRHAGQRNGIVRNYGYKNHVNVDREHKFIRKYRVTPVNVHDSQRFVEMLDDKAKDRGVWTDMLSGVRKKES